MRERSVRYVHMSGIARGRVEDDREESQEAHSSGRMVSEPSAWTSRTLMRVIGTFAIGLLSLSPD
jgi:hypothetical protein